MIQDSEIILSQVQRPLLLLRFFVNKSVLEEQIICRASLLVQTSWLNAEAQSVERPFSGTRRGALPIDGRGHAT